MVDWRKVLECQIPDADLGFNFFKAVKIFTFAADKHLPCWRLPATCPSSDITLRSVLHPPTARAVVPFQCLCGEQWDVFTFPLWSAQGSSVAKTLRTERSLFLLPTFGIGEGTGGSDSPIEQPEC